MSRHILSGLLICLFLGIGFLKGVSLTQLLNFQSVVIVVGGLLLVIWVGYPRDRVRQVLESLRHALRRQEDRDYESKLLSQVLELAGIYRLNGPSALERAVKELDNDFLQYGATLVVEGYDIRGLVAALEREHQLRNRKAANQVHFLATLSRLSPALGMAGTVISLMQVMQDLGTYKGLGQGLGLALSSTLYGILLANLFFLPLQLKLQQYFERHSRVRRMLIEALMGLQQAEHPLRIAERLNSYELYCRLKRRGGERPAQVIPLEREAA